MSTAKRRTKTKAPGIFRSSSGAYEISYRDSDGRLRFKTVGADFEAAKAARADVVSRKARGERVAPARVTFETYGRQWLTTLTLRDSTIALYRSHFEKHLLPAFGSKRVAEITPDHVAAWIATMSRKGYSPHTIRGALTPLSRIFRHAERANLIPTSPLRKLETSERPAASNGERRSLDSAEISRLLDAAETRHKPMIAVGAFAGLRISEALGLTWADVDFDEGTIRVRKQFARDGRRVDPKTPRAVRSVVLVPQVGRILKEHRMASPFKAPTDFVFAGPAGKGRDHRSTSRIVQRIVEKAGLPETVTFHTLRHGFASMLIGGLKMDVESVSRQLGHATSAITLVIYSHEFDRTRNVDKLRDALEGEFTRMADASS